MSDDHDSDDRAKDAPARKFDALPDPADFRDRLFVPTLVEVPTEKPLEEYREHGIPVLDQGGSGACTGYALATVGHYLLRTRAVVPDDVRVSARMLYMMAKRYDEWEGEDYDGSSARGAVKGWHKHGVCSDELSPYIEDDEDWELSDDIAKDALERPLGAYFRVNRRDLVAMHSAIAEAGILFATGQVHAGWDEVDEDGLIDPSPEVLGSHAFAVVGYDADGLWIQNSWGEDWGKDGFAMISYDDWLKSSLDVWVARLGAPVRLRTAGGSAIAVSAAARQSEAYAACDVRRHVVAIGNQGRFRLGGRYGTSKKEVEGMLLRTLPRFTESWSKPRLLIHAHGGLVPESSAVKKVMDHRTQLLDNEVYPLAFIWKTDFWSTVKNVLDDASRRRRAEGVVDEAKEFLRDRLDDVLEPLARKLGGKLQWDEMKENGLAATSGSEGGARRVAELLAELAGDGKLPELHLVGHSAGSIFLGPFLRLLTTQGKIEGGLLDGEEGLGLEVESCTLWAPACTLDLFEQCYRPAIEDGRLKRFALYTMSEEAELDDHCANIYGKSLLYLVSHALEEKLRVPTVRGGEPILGLASSVRSDDGVCGLFKDSSLKCDWVKTPNEYGERSKKASRAATHGGFDDDGLTLLSTLRRILGGDRPKGVG